MLTVGDVLAFKHRSMGMRAILINPFDQTVQEVSLNKDLDANLQPLYSMIGCECVCSVRIDEKNILWLDDNGLLGDQSKQRHFFFGRYPQMLAGRGVILGINARGSSVPTNLDVGRVFANVQWVNPKTAPALMPPTEPTIYELDENLQIKRGLSGPWANEGKE